MILPLDSGLTFIAICEGWWRPKNPCLGVLASSNAHSMNPSHSLLLSQSKSLKLLSCHPLGLNQSSVELSAEESDREKERKREGRAGNAFSKPGVGVIHVCRNAERGGPSVGGVQGARLENWFTVKANYKVSGDMVKGLLFEKKKKRESFPLYSLVAYLPQHTGLMLLKERK